MTGELLTQIAIIVVLMLINGLMAASEIALVSASRPHLIRKSDEDPDAKAALRLLEDPSRFLATIQVVITVAGFFASAVGAVSFDLVLTEFLKGTGVAFLQEHADVIAVVIVTLLLSFVQVVFGELVPKRLAIAYANGVALVVARPLEWVAKAATPVVVVMNFSARVVLTLLGQGKVMDDARPAITEADLRVMFDVAANEGDVEQREARMLHRVFEHTDRLAHEVMTPRPEMVWFDKDDTVADLLKAYPDTYHTRYPVCDGEPDNVIGVFSIKDVLREMAQGEVSPDRKLADLAHAGYFVPDTKRVGDLFEDMRTTGQPIAFVVDEYGGTAGLLTLKQLIEEIVGHVTDERAEEEEWERIDERTLRVDGSMRVDDANETLELGLPEGDYETVAGFILDQLGHIPKVGEQVAYNDLRLVVAEMAGVKIEQVDVIKG